MADILDANGNPIESPEPADEPHRFGFFRIPADRHISFSDCNSLRVQRPPDERSGSAQVIEPPGGFALRPRRAPDNVTKRTVRRMSSYQMVSAPTHSGDTHPVRDMRIE